MPLPPQLLFSQLAVKLPVPSVGVATRHAAELGLCRCPRVSRQHLKREAGAAHATWVYPIALAAGAAAGREAGGLKLVCSPHVQGSCGLVGLL